MKENVSVCSPAGTDKVYLPSRSVNTPLPDAFITVAEGRALPKSSVTRPWTVAWAKRASLVPSKARSKLAMVAIRIMDGWIEGIFSEM